jgi:hypothetical protein
MPYRFYVRNVELDSAKLFDSLKKYNVTSVSMSYDYIDLDFAEEPSKETLDEIKDLLKADRMEKVEAMIL